LESHLRKEVGHIAMRRGDLGRCRDLRAAVRPTVLLDRLLAHLSLLEFWSRLVREPETTDRTPQACETQRWSAPGQDAECLPATRPPFGRSDSMARCWEWSHPSTPLVKPQGTFDPLVAVWPSKCATPEPSLSAPAAGRMPGFY